MAERRVLRWEDPPEVALHGSARPKGRPSQWDAVAEELRSRPGVWGVVAEGPRATTIYTALIINGRQKSFRPSGAFEATSRTFGDRCIVYGRYVGEVSDA